MILRPFFALVEHLGLRVGFGALRPKPQVLAPSAVLIFFSLCGAVYSGCGPAPDSQLRCDPDGKNCFLCDANVCTPANPTVSSSGAGGNGGTGGTVETGGMGGMAGMGGMGTGGQAPCDPLVTTCGCKEAVDCVSDMLCIDGLCVAGCDTSFECGGGKVCVNGKCEVGCNAQKSCDTGQTCYKGFCIPDPTNPECTPNKFCPVGQTCVDGICAATCTTNTNCPTGEVCDSTTGGCIPNPSPIPSCGAGKPCPGTALCGNGGYCQFPCADVNACKLIDSRYVACDNNICKVEEEVSPECSLDKPCAAGKDCVSNKCL